MPDIVTHNQIEQHRRAVAQKTAEQAGRARAGGDAVYMQQQIEVGSDAVVNTPDRWDANNFATVIPVSRMPQQKVYTIKRDGTNREPLQPG